MSRGVRLTVFGRLIMVGGEGDHLYLAPRWCGLIRPREPGKFLGKKSGLRLALPGGEDEEMAVLSAPLAGGDVPGGRQCLRGGRHRPRSLDRAAEKEPGVLQGQVGAVP